MAGRLFGVGLGPGATRTLAVVVLIAFGVAMAVPSLAARLEAPLARLSRYGPRDRGDGFASGLLVGGALGFVYAPCAGPILAAVIAVGAASSRTVPVGIAFAAGSALVLLALSLGGRALAGRLRGPWLQRALAGVLVLTGVAMATNLDVRFQSAIADHLPAGSEHDRPVGHRPDHHRQCPARGNDAGQGLVAGPGLSVAGRGGTQ